MFLPEFLQSCFWDVDFDELNPQEYPYFVIERILEYGNKKDIDWLAKNFPKSTIKKTIISSRSLSPKSANFWALVLDLNRNKILCLKKLSTKKQNEIWPY